MILIKLKIILTFTLIAMGQEGFAYFSLYESTVCKGVCDSDILGLVICSIQVINGSGVVQRGTI